MKEATGELNLTIIVVIEVSLLIAFFYYTIWPSLNNNFEANSMCSKAWCENPCGEGSSENACSDAIGKLATCYVGKKEDGNKIMCPWKG